jgi:predicted amidohydrolase
MIVQNRLGAVGSLEGLDRALDLFEKGAGEHRVDLAVFPEVFATGFDLDGSTNGSRHSREILERMRREATLSGSDLLFTMLVKEDDRLYNRAHWIDGNGEVRGTYDKTHLFSRTGEDRDFTPGNMLKVFTIRGIPIGIITCYEIRFPELSMALARAGAKAIVCMAQWPSSRVHQWDSFLVARAVENQLYFIGANITGDNGKGEMAGHSAIVEPYGAKPCSLGRDEGHCLTEMDIGKVDRFRKGIRMSTDRRKVDVERG